MQNKPTYKRFGEKAILIAWNTEISVAVSEDILRFQNKILKDKKEHILDIIAAYTSLIIVFKEEIKDFEKIVLELQTIYEAVFLSVKIQKYIWEIPVCYHNEFGIDLQEMAQHSGLETSEIIKIHSEKIYNIHFIGFLPGFLYLGGLDKRIYFNRKENPRLKVPKGSVAIGGKQTGIYPTETSGGWQIIGKSPVNFFNINNKQPCFAKAGDFVKFTSISKSVYHLLKKEVDDNLYKLSKTLYDD